MKKLFLGFVGVFLLLSIFVNAKEDDVNTEELNDQNTSSQVTSSRGLGYYVDASFDWAFLWLDSPPEGRSASWSGTRNNSDASMAFGLSFSAGPTYSFNEHFSIGAKIGVGVQYLLIGFEKEEFTCGSYSYSSCGTQTKTTYSSIDVGFALPLALDIKYSLNKNLGFILGGQYDIGTTMSIFKLYGEVAFYRNYGVKIGWIPYSKVSDKVIKKALEPTSSRTGINLGDGKMHGLFLTISYLFW